MKFTSVIERSIRESLRVYLLGLLYVSYLLNENEKSELRTKDQQERGRVRR